MKRAHSIQFEVCSVFSDINYSIQETSTQHLQRQSLFSKQQKKKKIQNDTFSILYYRSQLTPQIQTFHFPLSTIEISIQHTFTLKLTFSNSPKITISIASKSYFFSLSNSSERITKINKFFSFSFVKPKGIVLVSSSHKRNGHAK